MGGLEQHGDKMSMTPQQAHDFLDMWCYLQKHPVVRVRFKRIAQAKWNAMQRATSLDELDKLDEERCQILLARWQELKSELCDKNCLEL